MIKFRKILGGAAILSAVLFGFAACSNSSGSDDNNGGNYYGYDDGETQVQVHDVSGMYTEEQKKQFIKENFNVSNETGKYYSGSFDYYSNSEYLKYPVITYQFGTYSNSTDTEQLRFKLGDTSFDVYMKSFGQWMTFDYKDILLEDEFQAIFGGNANLPLFTNEGVKSFFVKYSYQSRYQSYDYDEYGNYTAYYPTKYKYLCFALYQGTNIAYTAETDEFDEKTQFAVKKCRVQEGSELKTSGSVSDILVAKTYEWGSYNFYLKSLYQWKVEDNSNIITDQTYLDGTYTYTTRDYYVSSYGYKTAKCTITFNNGSVTMTSNDPYNVSGFTGTYSIYGSKITFTVDGSTDTMSYTFDGSKLTLDTNQYYLIYYKFYSESSYNLELTKTSSSSGSGNGGSDSGESVSSSDIIGTWTYYGRGNSEFEIIITADTVKKVAVYSNGSKGSGQPYDYSLSGSVMTITVNGIEGELKLSLSGTTLTFSADTNSNGQAILMGLFSTTDSSVSVTKKY